MSIHLLDNLINVAVLAKAFSLPTASYKHQKDDRQSLASILVSHQVISRIY